MVLVAALGAADPADATAKKHRVPPPRALSLLSIADPSVVKTHARLVVVSTGGRVTRSTSRRGAAALAAARPALASIPTWATGYGMWAADLARRGDHWVLYFAAPVAGMKPTSRCIGVAVGASPTGAFTPVGDRPLVCPPGAAVPPAEDRFLSAVPSRDAKETTDPPNAHGAIDPSFTLINKHPYLLYKTDGRPSSIRVLPLTSDGRHAAGPSRVLLRSAGVVENPVLVRRGSRWYLFTSEGDYATCDYHTVWRARRNPLGSWQTARAHLFLSTRRSRLCGPGGADVVTIGRETVMYLHAWTCHDNRKSCAAPLNATSARDRPRMPRRRLFGLEMSFTKKGVPVVRRWLRARGASS